MSGDREPIADLIERSSLGTPAAKAARASVDPERARAIVDEVNRRAAERAERALRDRVRADGPAAPDSPLAVMRWAAAEIDRLRAQRHAALALADDLDRDAPARPPAPVIAARLRAALDAGPSYALSVSEAAAIRTEATASISPGTELIAAERRRQITAEGWTPQHDDRHSHGELAKAAACYLSAPSVWSPHLPKGWPWEPQGWKPTPADRVRELVKAGALVAAEIDRLNRALPGDLPDTPQEG